MSSEGGRSVAIRLQGLTKYYGKTLAVDHLSFEIYENEIFGFLGPNGAGKTTTLLMLTTVIKPSEGTATVMGHDIRRDADAVRRLIDIAFQEPKLYWVNTPWEILVWHAKVWGYSGREAKIVVRDVMERLEIWESRHKKAFELSGGQRKKIEVAKVLITKPKIAIFDEPTAQIDVAGKHYIWSTIRELRDEGSTILLATNDLYEADVLSERVGIIHRGRLVALGTPAELKDKVPSGDIIEIRVEGRLDDSVLSRIKAEGRASEVNYSDGRLKIYLNRGEEFLPRLVTILMEHGVKIHSATVREPSLDDVFFYYTGLSIREAERRGR